MSTAQEQIRATILRLHDANLDAAPPVTFLGLWYEVRAAYGIDDIAFVVAFCAFVKSPDDPSECDALKKVRVDFCWLFEGRGMWPEILERFR